MSNRTTAERHQRELQRALARQRQPEPPQDTIVVQRLTVVGVVHANKNGERSMIAEAFLVAGEFLDQRAGIDGESDAVQFDFMGVTFRASADVPTPEQAAAE